VLKRRGEALLEAMLRPGMEIESLNELMGVGLGELARIAAGEEVQEQLHAIRVLAETHAQLMLSRWRVQAVTRLVELAMQKEDDDLAFDASRELVRADLLGQRSVLHRRARLRSVPIDEMASDVVSALQLTL